MEFGFEPVCDQVRAGSSYLDSRRRDSSNLLEPGRRPVRSWSKPNSITLSWSQTGLRLVADLLAGCRSATRLGPVRDQDSVMEFGLYSVCSVSSSLISLSLLMHRCPHPIIELPVQRLIFSLTYRAGVSITANPSLAASVLPQRCLLCPYSPAISIRSTSVDIHVK